MSLRFQRIASYYPSFLKQYYAEQPDSSALAYAEQHAALTGAAYGYADFCSTQPHKPGYETEAALNSTPQ